LVTKVNSQMTLKKN